MIFCMVYLSLVNVMLDVKIVLVVVIVKSSFGCFVLGLKVGIWIYVLVDVSGEVR